MSTYEVINVGQGDCILINPAYNCTFCNEMIFVDLGPGDVDITQCVDEEDEISIFLTHHHKDHIGGLKLFASLFDQINHIYLPLYQNEITLIADAILHMKAIKTSPNCEDFIHELQDIVGDQLVLRQFDSFGKSKITFAYEGVELCKHMKCLNPPKTFSKRRYDNDQMKEMARELFDSSFADFFISYIDNDGRTIDYSKLIEYDNVPYWINGNNPMDRERNSAGLAYVLGFFVNNIAYIRSLNASNSGEVISKIRKSFRDYVHDTCIVLKTDYKGHSMLLTGDASNKVFKRLLKKDKGILKADYLKLPHHGSKENYDREIIDAIDPKVIIISHNNGLFGRATDPHPNIEVLEDLENDDITLMITNDVIKYGYTIMFRDDHMNDPYGLVSIRDIK